MEIEGNCLLIKFVFYDILIVILITVHRAPLIGQNEKSNQNQTELFVVEVATSVLKIDRLKGGRVRWLHARVDVLNLWPVEEFQV
jgi:hypothetical protein